MAVRRSPRVRWALGILIVLLLAGCTRFPGQEPEGPIDTGLPPPPTPAGPPLVFGGVVRDAATGALVPQAYVRLDLAQAQPCGRQGVGWTSWEPAQANGTWGPLEVPRPRSDDVAFFLHVLAEGYSENATFIGPTQARADISNLTVIIHPDASVEGSAPPGTLVALDAPGFPRVTLASANGTFVFPGARAANATLVAGTQTPYATLVRAPSRLEIPEAAERGWILEGVVKGPTGAPLAADVVAWNGTALASVGRASENGVFTLPLAREPASLRIEARTSDNHYGGALQIDIAGSPAVRETILAKARC